LTTAIEKRF